MRYHATMAHTRRFRTRLRASVAGAAVLAVAATATTVAVQYTAEAAPAAATIRYTEFGIPHITASDFAGLGEGYGYAVAKDNLCLLADTYLTANGERSRFLGPDGQVSPGQSATTTNLNSDLYFTRLKDAKIVEGLVDLPAPQGPEPEVKEVVRGYAKGYNRYLAETGVGNISDPACRGKDWVRPISDIDVYRHVHMTVIMGSTDYVLDGVVGAKPAVVPANAPAPKPAKDTASRIASAIQSNRHEGMGSNGIAAGSQGVSGGKSVLLGNPHFPWHGKNRMWQSHLTIPGKLNVSGASLLGLPAVNIGHNDDVAWTHTVATVAPFGLFEVPVVPWDPTKYLVDGKVESMTAQQVSVDVRNADGSTGKVERTIWSTRYGPVTTSIMGTIPLPWALTAHSVREANLTNLRGMNTWLNIAKARDTGEIKDVLRRTQGIPWVNTIASDRKGNAFYGDIQVVPHITDEKANACNTLLGKVTFSLQGLSILDGGRGACQWGNDPDALEPGLLGPSRMPSLTRKDFVTNANDSAWLANPAEPLSHPRVMGDMNTARSTRTQQSIVAAQRRLAGVDGLPGKGFDGDTMREVLFRDDSRNAELARTDTVAMCKGFLGGLAPFSGGLINVSEACPVLENWDGSFRADSRGSVLFQRFWTHIGLIKFAGASLPGPWKDGFDPKDPVNTPRKLATDRPDVWLAFGNAVNDLRAAGIPLAAPLSDGQSVTRNGKRIPIHGGQGQLGVLNVITPLWDPKAGYPEIRHGSSFIQVTHFGDGAPSAHSVLTYSQSTDPTSPHYADQTELFSAGKWVPERFTEEQINASPELTVVTLSR
ncbi:acyl-homoserine-lactone acylase [Herbihabitans rhizosphaerae]|uniref:Acyl-homoserine-lactone acylase n=1 Tax=Herbihabitans rhizosphaerae TaxID=1872711 RepID=A0A4Q7KJY0_9PSEU|nr:penicillin acylase family protein [Herbihabitans rhizosphaerae]RZS36859.1 acyl-homoserine-lactone acylase [Herbihabitans rhizosphaerae]